MCLFFELCRIFSEITGLSSFWKSVEVNLEILHMSPPFLEIYEKTVKSKSTFWVVIQQKSNPKCAYGLNLELLDRPIMDLT